MRTITLPVEIEDSKISFTAAKTAFAAMCASGKTADSTVSELGLAQVSAVDILYRLKQNTGPYANGGFSGLELELCDLRHTQA